MAAIIVGAIIGAVIGGTVAGISAAQNGEDALGVTLAVFEGIFVGGVIGGAVGALVGVAPSIGASLSTMMSGTAGAGAVALTSSYVVAAGATAALGMNLVFMGNPTTRNPNDPSRPHKGTKNGKAGWNKHSKRRSGGPEKKDSRMKYHKWKRGMGFFLLFGIDFD